MVRVRVMVMVKVKVRVRVMVMVRVRVRVKVMNNHEINKCVKCNKNYLIIYRGDEVVNSIVRCDECNRKVTKDIENMIDEAYKNIREVHG